MFQLILEPSVPEWGVFIYSSILIESKRFQAKQKAILKSIDKKVTYTVHIMLFLYILILTSIFLFSYTISVYSVLTCGVIFDIPILVKLFNMCRQDEIVLSLII